MVVVITENKTKRERGYYLWINGHLKEGYIVMDELTKEFYKKYPDRFLEDFFRFKIILVSKSFN